MRTGWLVNRLIMLSSDALKRIDRDRLVAHLVLKLVNVEDFDPLTGEQARTVLPEKLGGKTRRLEFAQVLLAQSLIRS